MPGRIWVELEEDGCRLGPITVPVEATADAESGWLLSGAIAPARRGPTLLEVWNVSPRLGLDPA